MAKSPLTSRIDSLLSENGISKGEFYNACGITSSAYSLWNTGKSYPRKPVLDRIASYLGVTYEYLVAGAKKDPSPEVDGTEDKVAIAKIALFGGDGDVTDEMWEEAKIMAQIIKDKHRRQRESDG